MFPRVFVSLNECAFVCIYVCMCVYLTYFVLYFKAFNLLNNAHPYKDCGVRPRLLDIHINTKKEKKETRKFILRKRFFRLAQFSSFHANKHATCAPNSVTSEVVLYVHGV